MANIVIDDITHAPKAGTPIHDDLKLRLDEYTSQATIQYSKKRYDEAAELYAHATELQAEMNGEMSPRNADLLYAYGRCLYQVAVKKSDVLGSKVANEKAEETPFIKKTAREVAMDEETLGSHSPIARSSAGTATIPENSSIKTNKSKDSTPYFQFNGDEDFDSSNDEDENADADADENEEGPIEDDDFAIAYEVLDLARILLIQNIEDSKDDPARLQEHKLPSLRQLHERLADTYDLQAEISLEGERFEDAVVDLRSALEWKTQLFPFESNFLAEAHYKLSLALEFSSVTQSRDSEGELEEGKPVIVDEQKRADAIKEMESAIASCKARIGAEELKRRLASEGDHCDGPTDNIRAIQDVQDMVMEMQQRLLDLRQSPASINAPTITDESNPLADALSTVRGESAEQRRATLEKAMEGANDLTSLVKKRKPVSEGQRSHQLPVTDEQNGKRKRGHEHLAAGKRIKS